MSEPPSPDDSTQPDAPRQDGRAAPGHDQAASKDESGHQLATAADNPADAVQPDPAATGSGQPGTLTPQSPSPGSASTGLASTGELARPRPATRQHTRIGAAWAAVAVAAVVLIVLLIFILQNLHQARVEFFGVYGRFPVGVLVLFSAVGGALVVIVLGAARMIQLRWLARQDRRATRTDRPT